MIMVLQEAITILLKYKARPRAPLQHSYKGGIFMETRRERKNIILKIPRSQLVNRKIKQVNARIKTIVKKIKHG